MVETRQSIHRDPEVTYIIRNVRGLSILTITTKTDELKVETYKFQRREYAVDFADRHRRGEIAHANH